MLRLDHAYMYNQKSITLSLDNAKDLDVAISMYNLLEYSGN